MNLRKMATFINQLQIVALKLMGKAMVNFFG
jgi:hypothetical protein